MSLAQEIASVFPTVSDDPRVVVEILKQRGFTYAEQANAYDMSALRFRTWRQGRAQAHTMSSNSKEIKCTLRRIAASAAFVQPQFASVQPSPPAVAPDRDINTTTDALNNLTDALVNLTLELRRHAGGHAGGSAGE
jgi:hypothetical protein